MHALIRWIGRRCLDWLYRERHVIGSERIPTDGPVLLIGNHPNDIPDVLCGFLCTDRPLRYVATISAASSAASQAVYRGLGVIPVARVRDARKMRQQGVDAAAVNVDAFRRVADALREGAIVGVFPEGGVHDGPSLGHFRSGVSKMALDSTLDGTLKHLKIVAVGVQYEAPRTPRSDLTVVVGEPFDVDDWLAAVVREEGRGATVVGDARREARLALALRDRMRAALLAVTRNADSWEQAERRERMTAAVGALTVDRSGGATQSASAESAASCQRRCGELAESSEGTLSEASEAIAEWVVRAGAKPGSVRDTARVLAAAGVSGTEPAWPSMVQWVAATPFAAVGWLVHAPVFGLVWWLAQRSAKDRAELMARACVPGIYLIFAWYLLLGVLIGAMVATGDSGWWTIPIVAGVLAVLPSLGDVSVYWRDAMRALSLRHRVSRWPAHQRAAVRTLAEALRAAWTHRNSRDSSAFVKVAVESAGDRPSAIPVDAGVVAPVTRSSP